MAKMSVETVPAVVKIVEPEKKVFKLEMEQDDVNYLHAILSSRNILMAGPYGAYVNTRLYDALDQHVEKTDEKYRALSLAESKRFKHIRTNDLDNI